ncbi:MAG: hypothetical protein L3J71_04715 [Victivallaceae bacterium]|nr:hypothetical protein [Victivallaceae bacterium]
MIKNINNIKKSYFNIVEIALALAIVGIGMASILALFPVGISASRNAIGNTLAAQVSEEFMGYIQARAEQSQANYDAILDEIPEVGAVNDLKVEMMNAISLSEDETSKFLNDLSEGTDGNVSEDSDYVQISQWDNFFRSKHSDRKFLYIMLQRVEDIKTAPEFSAAVLMWRAPLDYSGSGGGAGMDVISWTPPMSEIMSLNIEVSWPLTKIYKDRDKRYFYTIIKRP